MSRSSFGLTHFWDAHYTISNSNLADPTKKANNKRYTCNFCGNSFSGSAGRARSHIAGRAEPGKHKEVKECSNPDIAIQQRILEEYAERDIEFEEKKRLSAELSMMGEDAPAAKFSRMNDGSTKELSSDSDEEPSQGNQIILGGEPSSATASNYRQAATPTLKRGRRPASSASSLSTYYPPHPPIASSSNRPAPPVSTMTHEEVSEYYSKVLSKTSDLKTDACCTAQAPPTFLRNALSKIHDSVLSKYYGCGLIAPELLSGLRILDLGCGSGRDCYVLSQLVGEHGTVVGVDMTEGQLEIATDSIDFHRQAFKYKKANTLFLAGYIERLSDIAGLEENSFDIVVSNCVVNLSPDKAAVLLQAHKLLKTGGEMYFSDVYSSQRVPKSLAEDPVLWGECLSGALYWNDFLQLAKACGFTDPRLVTDAPIAVKNEQIEAKLGNIKFHSATYRLFKLGGLEGDCEDYGQAVCYRGTIPEHHVAPRTAQEGGDASSSTATAAAEAPVVRRNLSAFALDSHHNFVAGKVYPVCGNTFRMLRETRFAPHFDFYGTFDTHHGIFPGCGKNSPFGATPAATGAKTAGKGCC